MCVTQEISDLKNKNDMNRLEIFSKHYYNLGLNVTCLSDEMTEYNFYCRNKMKSPNHAWVHLLERRQTPAEFQVLNWDIATGVGCLGGYDNLRVLDIDGCNSIILLEEVLKTLNLPLNYKWVVKSGSKNGYHIFFYANKFEDLKENDVVTAFPPNKKYEHLFEKIEILWATNVVLPPSLHPTGNIYEFLNCDFPTSLPNKIDRENLNELLKTFLQVDLVLKKSRYGDVLVDIKYSPTYNDVDEIYIPEEKSDLILVVDIETDGLIKREGQKILYPEIVQIAWLIMDKRGTIYKKESSLIKDDRVQLKNTSNIHRISQESVNRIGKPKYQVLKKLASDLQSVVNVSCHNSNFDIPILAHHFEMEGLSSLKNNQKIICTMQASVEYCNLHDGFNLKFPKLTELYNKLFNTTLHQLHNAEADVLATAICLKKMIEIGLVK